MVNNRLQRRIRPVQPLGSSVDSGVGTGSAGASRTSSHGGSSYAWPALTLLNQTANCVLNSSRTNSLSTAPSMPLSRPCVSSPHTTAQAQPTAIVNVLATAAEIVAPTTFPGPGINFSRPR